MSDATLEEGMTVRRQVLGDDHVDRATASKTGFTAEFQEFITRYAWGAIWTRPGLDRRTRSCITVAMLAALGRDEELALHVRAAPAVEEGEEDPRGGPVRGRGSPLEARQPGGGHGQGLAKGQDQGCGDQRGHRARRPTAARPPASSSAETTRVGTAPRRSGIE